MAQSPKITVIVPEADKVALEKIASEEGRTISNLASRIIHQWLVNEGKVQQ